MARDVFGLELAEDVLRLPALPLLLLQHQLAELVTLRLQQLNRCYLRTFKTKLEYFEGCIFVQKPSKILIMR